MNTNEPLSKQTVAKIFKVMASRFQALWLPRVKTPQDIEAAMRIWHKDLTLLGVTDASARIGMARTAQLKFGPVPSEFAELCRPKPDDLGIPGETEAYRQMVEVVSQWGLSRPELFPHPTVEVAARQIGSYVIRHSTDWQLRALFSKTFTEIVARALRGERVEAPLQPALCKPERPEKSTLTPEQRKAKVRRWKDKVFSQLGIVST